MGSDSIVQLLANAKLSFIYSEGTGIGAFLLTVVLLKLLSSPGPQLFAAVSKLINFFNTRK